MKQSKTEKAKDAAMTVAGVGAAATALLGVGGCAIAIWSVPFVVLAVIIACVLRAFGFI